GLAVEAYSWGALTSGARGFLGWVQRALWLLLLPFALTNLAYWARLGLGRSSPESRLGASAVRVSSLLLTLFVVVVTATVFVDLVGWQCYRGGSPACPGLPSYVDWMGRLTPGQRLAVGALGPLLVVLVFVLLTNRSLSRYESTPDPMRGALDRHRSRRLAGAPEEIDSTWGSDQVLLHPDLFNGTLRTRILRDAHLAAAMAVIVGFVGGHVLDAWQGGSGWHVWFAVLVVLAGLVLLLSVLLVSSTLPGDLERQLLGAENAQEQLWTRRGRVLVVISSATLLALLASLALAPAGGFDELLDFFGRNAWVVILFIALTALHLCVFAGGRMLGPLRVAVPVGVAALLALGCGIVYWPVWHGGRSPSTDRVLIVLVVAFAVFAVLAGWHYALAHDTRAKTEGEVAGEGTASERDRTIAGSAFAGAGASVLLAAAAWTALLFATAGVIGAANLLNGSAPLTTLETQLPARELPAQLPSGYHAAVRPDLTVSGPVTLSGAVYAFSGGQLVVYSGTLHVTTAWRGDPLSVNAPLHIVPTGGPVEVATVSIPRHVTISNSCDFAAVPVRERAGVRPGSFVCQQGGPDFVSSSVLPVPRRLLSIDAPTTTVDLALARPGYTPLVVPQVMVWAPLAQTLWLLLVAVAVVACLVRFGRARATIRDDDSAYSSIPPLYRAGARDARATAAFAHRAERVLDVIGFVTSPVALALIVLSSLGRSPWELIPHIRPLADLSLYVVSATAAGLILLGSRIRTSDSVRRAVGVIWDLATFWPRSSHPLSPPCYSERVVPEISRRVLWALEVSGDRAVVLSGHSQGSLIVTTVAARLPRLERLRMITYGSQVRALYGRFFPAVFGPHVVGYEPTTGPMLLGRAEPDLPTPLGAVPAAAAGTVRSRLSAVGHWVNLFRRTDPLGFRVFSDHDSALDVPTLEVPLADMGDPGPPVKGHSDYQHTPEYRTVVGGWTHEPYVDHPTSTTDVLPLPAP
ncbi:MAG: hypothetical protein JOZ82_08355, partial [Marmoricola sp.]|nr:hypothetical protein [Marmoricola sp.]